MAKKPIFKGVNKLHFDSHAEQQGRLGRLGLGKDQRKFKQKYAGIIANVIPLVCSVSFMTLGLAPAILNRAAGEALATHSDLLLLGALASGWWWVIKRRNFYALDKSLFDTPRYLGYNDKIAEEDTSPKSNEGDQFQKFLKKGKREHLTKEAGSQKKLGKAVFFLGHEIYTGQELHLEDDKVRTHVIIFGTTGSGKTEAILSICVNFLVQSSGMILVDGKGDTLLAAKVFALAWATGRTDDLYFLNFMPSGKKFGEKRYEQMGNTFNFFADSSSEELDEIVGGLLPSEGGSGGGIWEGRAASGISGINKPIVYLRDNGFLNLDPSVYRQFFNLETAAALARNEHVPKQLREGLNSVLDSVKYEHPVEGGQLVKQADDTTSQWMFISMQYTETFGLLADSYRDITVAQVPDISMTDIILRRRILVVLLPSLAKSEQNVRNLGRILIAMSRNVSSKAIGGHIEGTTKSVIDSKSTNAINTFGLMFDEFGAYSVSGAATLPAMLRSLNIMCLFAGQDYGGFEKGDEKDSETIFANCTIKIALKLEDPKTFELFQKSAGKEYTLVAQSFESKDTMTGTRQYREAETATLEQRDVLDFSDLKNISNGQGVFIFGAKTLNFASFYADPLIPVAIRTNHMLQIKAPDFGEVQEVQIGVTAIVRRMHDSLEESFKKKESRFKTIFNTHNATFDALSKFMRVKTTGERPPNQLERTLFAVAAVAKKIELVDKRVSNSVRIAMGEKNHLYRNTEIDTDAGAMTLSSTFKSQIQAITEHDTDNMSVEQVREYQVLERAIDALEIDKTNLKLSEARSFKSLEAIGINPFDLEEKLASIEHILISKRSDIHQKERVSKLFAAKTVNALARSTNIDIATKNIQSRTNSETSTKKLSQQGSDFINMIKNKEKA
jgi:intracellular multiplication protein IcmO